MENKFTIKDMNLYYGSFQGIIDIPVRRFRIEQFDRERSRFAAFGNDRLVGVLVFVSAARILRIDTYAYLVVGIPHHGIGIAVLVAEMRACLGRYGREVHNANVIGPGSGILYIVAVRACAQRDGCGAE